MKTYEITEEQIKELSIWGNVQKVKEWWPEVFNKKQIGRWYKIPSSENLYLLYVKEIHSNGNVTAYGFDHNDNWATECLCSINMFTEASFEEVKSRLIEEARRRGLIPGAKLTNGFIPVLYSKIYNYYQDSDTIYLNGVSIYTRGTWTAVMEETPPLELTIDDIAAKYGVTPDKIKIKK